jgi:O-antigen/teichoic acid export membrane protein
MSQGDAARPRTSGGKFLRNVGALAGSTAASQLLIVATAPIIARLYSPDAFGTFSLLVTFVGFASVGSALGYERAIVGARTTADAADLTLLSLVLAPVLALMAGGVLFLMVGYDLLGFGVFPMVGVTWTVVLIVLIQAYVSLRFWHLREERVGLLARTTITQNSGRALLPILAAVMTRGWAGLALGETIGRCFGLVPMVRAARGSLWRWPRIDGLRQVARKHALFAYAGLPSTLLNALSIALPLPLIAGRFGAESAGLFALAQRILQAPIGLVGVSVAEAFHARLARHSRDLPAYVPTFFLKTAGLLAGLAIVPAVAVLLFGVGGFAWVLGARWGEAGRFAVAIIPWTTAQLVVSPLSRAVFVLGGQRQKLVYDICSLLLVAGTFWVSGREGWDILRTVQVLGWAQVGAYAVYFGVLWDVVRRAGSPAAASVPSASEEEQ